MSEIEIANVSNLIDYFNKGLKEDQASYRFIFHLSLIEKLVHKLIFKLYSKDDYLTEILKSISEGDIELLDNMCSTVNEIFKKIKPQSQSSTDSEYALTFYTKIMSHIYKLKSHKENQKKSLEDSLMIEELLSNHIEKNLFESNPKNKLDEEYFNENYVKILSEKQNFEYSITSIYTLFKIMEKLESMNLKNKLMEDIDTYGIISEKIKKKLDKNTANDNKQAKNIIDYFIKSHLQNITKELYNDSSTFNNYEIENKICLSLFLIKKIIKDYSFYFEKKPEIERLYIELKKYKDWPLPIGHIGMNLFETITNELYFQGFTLMDQIKKIYFIDTVDAKDNLLECSVFNSAYFIYEKNEKQDVIEHFPDMMKNKNLDIKDFISRIFVSIVMNSNETFNKSQIENIVKKFTTKSDNKNYSNDLQDDLNQSKEEIKQPQYDDNIKNCINTLFKLIYVGLDKSYEDFLSDLQKLSKPLLEIQSIGNSNNNISKAPISKYRSFLKPYYKIVNNEDNSHDIQKNLYKNYKESFETLFNKYFIYLKDDQFDVDEKRLENMKKRINLYIDYKMKYILVEKRYMLSYFINSLFTFYNRVDENQDVHINYDMKNFWSNFLPNNYSFILNFILYLVPRYDSYEEGRLHNNNIENKNNKSVPLLSEYLSYHDYIYHTLIYNTWLLNKEIEDSVNQHKLSSKYDNENENEFFKPYKEDFIDFIKQPLDLYISDSEFIFNLKLFKVTTDKDSFLFWRSIEIESSIDNKKTSIFEIKLTCVDLLGVEYNNNIQTLELKDLFQIKIFNVFYKKDSPLNYNMTSNNGWLEVFILRGSSSSEKNLGKNLLKSFNYEEFIYTHFEIDSQYDNYKVNRIEIKSLDNKINFLLKYDDLEEKKPYPYCNIEKYMRNDRHFSIPVATFNPI